MSNKIIFLVVLFLLLSLSVVTIANAVWQNPTASPPAGNLSAPVNTGSDAQTKIGELTLSGGVRFPGSGIWNTSGSVGIGTTPAGYKLDVIGGSDSLAARFNSTSHTRVTITTPSTLYNPKISWDRGGSNAWEMGVSDDFGTGGLFIYGGSTPGFKFGIKADGNVGIGVTGPGAKLEVAGDILFGATTNTGRIKSDGTNTFVDAIPGTGAVIIRTGGAVEAMRVTSASNVVIGNTYWYQGYNSAGSAQPLIRSRGMGYAPGTYAGVQIGQTTDHIALFIDPGSITGGAFSGNVNELMTPNDWKILQANSGGTDWFATMSLVNGNVGIGVTTPTSDKLQVMGYVRADGSTGGGFRVVQNNIQQGIFTTYRNILGSGTDNTPTLFAETGMGIYFAPGGSATVQMSLSGSTLTVGGGSGKLNVGTVDPIYTIGGEKFATYVASMTGQKEETTGIAKLSNLVTGNSSLYAYEIDLGKAEKGSDLWLFYQITDFGSGWDNLSALLTANFAGDVWYEKKPSEKQLIIYAQLTPNSQLLTPEVSYRLTAPRFDHEKWPNVSSDSAEGFVLQEK